MVFRLTVDFQNLNGNSRLTATVQKYCAKCTKLIYFVAKIPN